MRILVTYPLNSQLVRSPLGELIVYRPELASQRQEALDQALSEHLPDAALVNGTCPSPTTLTAWPRQAHRAVRLIRCHPGNEQALPPVPDVSIDQFQGTPGHLPDDLRALGLAERQLMHCMTERRLAASGISPSASRTLSGSHITLVGAGIVNLVTALELVEKGAEIDIIEASPDPRSKPHWQQLGATHGGGNARMFCFTEADNYNKKAHAVGTGMDRVFGRCITEGGWLLVEPTLLTRPESDWIDSFDQLPRWRAEVFTEDIYRFNKASYPLWEKLRRQAPDLFDGVHYQPGVLRLYAQREEAEADQALHSRLGSLIRALDPSELSRRHPAYREAVAQGQIARALEVRGFTLQVHDLVTNLLGHLEARGVRLRWNQRVSAIERAKGGGVTGLCVEDHVVRSEHYVLSPGAYGNPLLEGTRTAGKIQGILGLWLNLPNLQPRLQISTKIHRAGSVGEISNVTVSTDPTGRPILILSSGFGFVGSRPLDLQTPEIARLFATLEETARTYFPHAHQAATRENALEASRKACLRPFTSTGLGTFEVAATATGGRLIIACGHNTGGFTQAPAVAEAVTATLEGKHHAMQALYDPERGV